MSAALGCLAVLACAAGASGHVHAVDGYRLVKPPIIVREDARPGEAAGVTVYFRMNRRLPRRSYATVDGRPPESRDLTRFVLGNDRCYRLDEGGTKRSPWAGVPLGTAATFRLHIRGHAKALTAQGPLRARLPVERGADGLGSEDLAYARRLHCPRARHAR